MNAEIISSYSEKYILDWKQYISRARQAAAEGCVLLANDNHALPLKKGTKVSVFGCIQLHYYKSGTGSGGKVNVSYTHGILEGLRESGQVEFNEDLLALYRKWDEAHPFDTGDGWAREPWCQEEMPLSDDIAEAASAQSDIALVVIGRTAGEDHDNTAQPGSWYLTDTELSMLQTVRRHFSRMAVLLNVGNIIDMSWMELCRPDAVLYIWQGGMEGGIGVADVLTGKVSPCGRLTDTIARNIHDYPSDDNFGASTENYYQEDIYVGYRYFETFAPEKVLFPFGFGLSYTDFSVTPDMKESADQIIFTITVRNTGAYPGKEVVQVYCQPPQGVLGRPSRELAAFTKTRELQPGEEQTLRLAVHKSSLSAFDDSGITGHPFCRVLEKGVYRFYTGKDVRSAQYTGEFSVTETTVTETLHEAMAPVSPFTRIRPLVTDDGSFSPVYEEVPLRLYANDPAAANPAKASGTEDPKEASCSDGTSSSAGEKILLKDVLDGNASFTAFLSQLTDEDLCCLVRGEGMCSPKVTPGTAAAFGGVTARLQSYGIPAGCCTDGPSGMRLDCGTNAFSLPNGTLLACTFNTELVADLFEMEGLEMRNNRIDTLLGPGINIHRHPLCGRNFEYHSEDPYLTGKMACAQLDGMHRAGVTGTIKHFCANNQEAHRLDVNSIVSQRALREIYLRPFEMAVKKSRACSIMTTYGAVNGIWTAGNYDQNTLILREEWGFDGIVMTDWWSQMNDEGEAPDRKNLAAMVRAQNDLYMVTRDAASNCDNLAEALAAGRLTRGQLLVCAENICRFLMHSPAMERITGREIPVEIRNQPEDQNLTADFDMDYIEIGDETTVRLENADTSHGSHPLLNIRLKSDGMYLLTLTGSVQGNQLAQVTAALKSKGDLLAVFSFSGTEGTDTSVSQECSFFDTTHYLSVYCSENGLQLKELTFKKIPDPDVKA